jgi:RNA polymerase sigma factor (sigma-70 family)
VIKSAQRTDFIMSVDVTAHRSSLYHFILKRVRDPWVSEDLAQETVTRLLHYSRSQAVGDARALGFQIATNLVRDHFRALRRSETQPLSEDLVSDMPAQEQMSIDRQRVDSFSRALAAMKPLRREVFIRRRLHGQSHAEIAAAMQLSHAAVEKHIVRALQWLHQEMSREDTADTLGEV